MHGNKENRGGGWNLGDGRDLSDDGYSRQSECTRMMNIALAMLLGNQTSL